MIGTITAPPFPSDDDLASIADWAEVTTLATGSPVSRGKLATTIAREGLSDARADGAWNEIERRAPLLGSRWPITIDGFSIKPKTMQSSKAIAYFFLSALGLRLNIDNEGRALFEICVTEWIRGITRHKSFRVGAPRIPPGSLADAVRTYCKTSLEPFGTPPPATDGDLGLDVVSWMAFEDDRGSFLHFIGQCATGADWPDKLTELNPRKWTDHINWAVPPVRFFATPYVLTADEMRRKSFDGGLILDRPRLIELAWLSPLSSATLTEVKNYCKRIY